MPGVPLFNLGNILGGLSQGWNQSQSQGLQQALQRYALQQQMQQQKAQGLAALALQAGLLNPSTTTNPLPLSPVNNLPAPPGSAGPAPAPPSATPPNGAQPGYAPPLPGAPAAPQRPADAGYGGFTVYPPANVWTATPPLTGQGNSAPVSPPSQQLTRGDQIVEQPIPPPSATAASAATAPESQETPASTSPAAITPAAATAPEGGNVGVQLPNGQTMDLSSLFRTVDYGQLARGIAKLAPPGTDLATIYQAVADLSKMSQGDKEQQVQAGLLARTILGGQFRLLNTGITQEGANTRQQTNIAAQNQRQQAGFAERERITGITQGRIDARAKQRLDAEAQRTQVAATNQKNANLARQVQALRAQMAAIKPDAGGNYTDDQQKQLKAIGDQLGKIAGQLGQSQDEPSGQQ